MIKATSLADRINKYFPGVTKEKMTPHDYMISKGQVPVPMACAVIKALPPRDEEFEFYLDLGMSNIEKIFSKSPLELRLSKELTFMFPERWMSVHEQRMFPTRIREHPQAKEIEAVWIITSSPIIIGECWCVTIIEFPDKHHYEYPMRDGFSPEKSTREQL
jgi:hypothetical protein